MFDDQCPVCRTAEVISGKWTLLIIRDLADSSLRFCEIERSLEGSAPGPCRCACAPSRSRASSSAAPSLRFPRRVEYALTDKGRALVPLIEDMRTYGNRWLPAPERGATPAPV